MRNPAGRQPACARARQPAADVVASPMTTRVQFADMQDARARLRAPCHLAAELLALSGIDEPTLLKPDGTPDPGRWHVAASGVCGRPRKAGREPQKRPDKPSAKVCGYDLHGGLWLHWQISPLTWGNSLRLLSQALTHHVQLRANEAFRMLSRCHGRQSGRRQDRAGTQPDVV